MRGPNGGPLTGLQGAALGWLDPFSPGLATRWWRTGEGREFAPQDPPPTPKALSKYLRGLALDFYVHPVLPVEANYRAALQFAHETGISLLVGNEIGTINGTVAAGTNRYDPSHTLLRRHMEDGSVLGVVYDESEHLQIHPDQYSRNYAPEELNYQWGRPSATGLHPDDVIVDARGIAAHYRPGSPFHEFVFPTLVHALAGAGFVPTPKLLKESCAPVHLSVAMGAAMQYRRPLGICVDLWGPDVGPWFTRLWGSPGHSPAEFVASLELAAALQPQYMYVENMDGLCRSTGDRVVDTEFGDAFREWRRRAQSAQGRFVPHDLGEIVPSVAVIYADRGDVAVGHPNPLSPGRETGRTFFEAMHVLTHGHSPATASTLHFSGVRFPNSSYDRNNESLSDLPRELGEAPDRVHHFFAPMNNVAVFDEHAGERCLASARAIVVVGDAVPTRTLEIVISRARGKTDCVVARSAIPAGFSVRETARLIVVDSMLDGRAREMLSPHLGAPNLYRVRFTGGSVEVRPSGDRDHLEIVRSNA